MWHSGTTSWPSGHLGPSGTSGNLRDVQGSSVTSGMTLWHAGTLLACWHTGTHDGTVDRPMAYRLMMNTQPLNLVDFGFHTAIVVGLQFQGL